MRALKVLTLLVVLIGISACSCRTRNVSPEDVNVPVARVGGELNDINYAFDSYELDSRAQRILQKNAEWLSSNQATKIEIQGHCDERGTNEYNMVLGAKRARAARDYLRSLGINEDRMSTVSYGEELPLDPRSNEEAWSRNRRAHFEVLR